jgi:hypothetical protein
LGPSRHFEAAQYFDRFRSEADMGIGRPAHPAGSVKMNPDATNIRQQRSFAM